MLTDALYGEAKFMDQASQICGGVQVVSQLRENRNIDYRGKKRNLKAYFNTVNKGVAVTPAGAWRKRHSSHCEQRG